MGIMNDGVKQWVFQRVTNAVVVTFGIVLAYLLLSGKVSNYDSLKASVLDSGLAYYIVLVLLLSCINSVLAGWQIDGDYSKKFGLPTNLLTIIALVVSAAYLLYGLNLLFV
ncbi:MAG: succinate dehydrogenase / fumarate reductase membrane anchor subunit [Cellvibrionaceae bacterium]|jgi:succinate dehydrogenase / fumarate reductase membrane anchor subunit